MTDKYTMADLVKDIAEDVGPDIERAGVGFVLFLFDPDKQADGEIAMIARDRRVAGMVVAQWMEQHLRSQRNIAKG